MHRKYAHNNDVAPFYIRLLFTSEKKEGQLNDGMTTTGMWVSVSEAALVSFFAAADLSSRSLCIPMTMHWQLKRLNWSSKHWHFQSPWSLLSSNIRTFIIMSKRKTVHFVTCQWLPEVPLSFLATPALPANRKSESHRSILMAVNFKQKNAVILCG